MNTNDEKIQWFPAFDAALQIEFGEEAKYLEFHNVNCRFCGAIHDVDWANISVLSQVIHNVNERKTVQTNMISFVSHGAGILKIS